MLGGEGGGVSVPVTYLCRRENTNIYCVLYSRISPNEVYRVTSTVVSLICSSQRHIYTTCAWYIRTNVSPLMDFGLPTLDFPIATGCINTSFSLTLINSFILHNDLHSLCAVQSSLAHAQCTQTSTPATTTAHYIYFHCATFLVPFPIIPLYVIAQYAKQTLVPLAFVCMHSREYEYAS